MAERRRSVFWKLLPWLVVFALGAVSGYWFRDQQQADRVREARQEVQGKALQAIRRGQRAAENVGAGARVAADSAVAAFRELTGDTAGDGG